MRTGVVRLVFLEGEDYEIYNSGTFHLPKDQPMVKVEYEGDDSTMICTLLSGGPVAVH